MPTTPHTPGPWTFDVDTGRILKEGEREPLATFYMMGDRARAGDLRLAAAAPDLLAALEQADRDLTAMADDAQNRGDGSTELAALEAYRAVRAAIAKARGD